MKKFKSTVIKVIAFIFLVIIADRASGFILRNLYFHEKTGPHYALNYVLKNCNAEILIFGSSRAVHHYDSRIFTDRLHMSCFNTGVDGGHSILLPNAQIKVITKRYSPKIIILEFNPSDLVHFTRDYDRLSVLLPYYSDFPEVRPFILLRSPYEKVKLLSAVYPFNSNIINIFRMYLNIHSENVQDYGGYRPIMDGSMNIGMVSIEPEIETPSVIDTNMVNSLKDIISVCKEKNITLMIINSPVFHSVNEKRSASTAASKLALEIMQRESVKHYDFSYDSRFAGHLEWFKDKEHLNNDGARVFTNLVIDRIINDK